MKTPNTCNTCVFFNRTGNVMGSCDELLGTLRGCNVPLLDTEALYVFDTFACNMWHSTQTYKHTSDNWYPNFQGGFVEVSYRQIPYGCGLDNVWRVLVQGADDFAMYFDCDDPTTAKQTYRLVVKLPDVTKLALRQLGFEVF